MRITPPTYDIGNTIYELTRYKTMIDHGGNVWQAKQKYRLEVNQMLDFSANINPLGFPKSLKRIINKNIKSLDTYPDPECNILKTELAKSIGLLPENLLIGNGSVELIYLIVKALSPKGVLIPIPTFSEYEKVARLNKVKSILLPSSEKENFKISLEKVLTAASKVDLVFLCNPNNPTGFLFSPEELMRVLSACKKKDWILVCDETFIDFVKDGQNITLLKEVAKVKKLLILRSFTKFFALPGLRIGYLAGDKRFINKISQYQPPWSVNTLAQQVAFEVIKDDDYIKRSKRFVLKERAFLFRELEKIKDLYIFPPSANFILCRLKETTLNSTTLSRKLGCLGILIRDCSNFQGLDTHYFRVAVKKREENLKLLASLREML